MRILAIDPGETTGVVFSMLKDVFATTTPTWQNLDKIIKATWPDVIVIEDFRLYGRAASSQIGSSFPTVKVIGVVEYLAAQVNIPIVTQMASQVSMIKSNPKISNPHIQSAWKHAELYRRKLERQERSRRG